MDAFLSPGPTPEDIFRQYAKLTGTAVMPAQAARWSLAYHQCRWNYISSVDIRTVQGRFDGEDSQWTYSGLISSIQTPSLSILN